MKLYRFSPIKNEEELLEAIKHTHFACFELCKKLLINIFQAPEIWAYSVIMMMNISF